MSQPDSDTPSTDKHTPLNIREQLIRDEGMRHEMYLDASGFLTIGVGHNLRARPLSDRAVFTILDDDIAATTAGVQQTFPWVVALSSARQGALINMAFNLGVEGLQGFVTMLAALKTGDWAGAARALRDSHYARQVGARTDRLARQILEDVWV